MAIAACGGGETTTGGPTSAALNQATPETAAVATAEVAATPDLATTAPDQTTSVAVATATTPTAPDTASTPVTGATPTATALHISVAAANSAATSVAATTVVTTSVATSTVASAQTAAAVSSSAQTTTSASAPLTGSLDKVSSLRGFSLAGVRTPALQTQDYADLASYRANIARIGVEADLAADGSYQMADSQWQYIQTTLAMGQKYGFKVIVTLTAAPWGEQSTYWTNADQQQSIVNLWTSIATRFKGNPAVGGYDLINEPVLPRDRSPAVGPNVDYWLPLATRIIQAIRAVDPDSVIVIEPSPWGLPKGFANMTPLPFSHVVYSFHFYAPEELTHQGLYNYTAVLGYPSVLTTKATLSAEMDPARAFVKAYAVPMYVGEFSIVRWAPGDSVTNYLSDVVDLIQAEGWNWTYHAFREYQGWDAEIAPGAMKATPGARSTSSPAIKLLVSKGFSKN